MSGTTGGAEGLQIACAWQLTARCPTDLPRGRVRYWQLATKCVIDLSHGRYLYRQLPPDCAAHLPRHRHWHQPVVKLPGDLTETQMARGAKVESDARQSGGPRWQRKLARPESAPFMLMRWRAWPRQPRSRPASPLHFLPRVSVKARRSRWPAATNAAIPAALPLSCRHCFMEVKPGQPKPCNCR